MGRFVKMKTRKIISIFLLFCLVCSVSSCSFGKKDNGQRNVELTFSFWEPGVYRELETALAGVASEYEKEHPGVHIKFITKPVESYIGWIKSKIITDSMPEIEANYGNELLKQYRSGLIVDISDHLEAESNYDKGTAWQNTFIPGKLEQANERTGEKVCIPLFGTELAMFYNKSIYDELNLKPPKTWREFIDNCEVIKRSGKVPIMFMAQKGAAFTWLGWEIGTGLYIKKYLGNKDININCDSVISSYEKARAVALGFWDISNDSEMQQDYKNYIAHLSEYLNYCGNSFDTEETMAKMEFLNGNAAHINTGSWDVGSFMNRKDSSFEIGTFAFPEFTEEDTNYPGGRAVANTVQSVAVTSAVFKEEGKLEAAVDFLQYLTSKSVYQKFINQTTEIPTVSDVKFDERLKDFICEGFTATTLFINTVDVANDILAGNSPVLDQDYFINMQKKEKKLAEQTLNGLNVSSDNEYYYFEQPFGGIYINDSRNE